nr:MAG TPA: hypothetical protein [Caudoviricetes sp.]
MVEAFAPMLFGPSVIQYVIFQFSPKNSRIRISLYLYSLFLFI